MPVKRALKLVDSLVFPVSFYSAEYMTPLVLPAKSFTTLECLLQAWESYLPEKLNQRACRLLLSVHKKSSRLTVLGDLGRFPVLLTALSSTLQYCQVLRSKSEQTLAGLAFKEMKSMVGRREDCWLGKVEAIRKLLDIPDAQIFTTAKAVGNIAKKTLQSKFSLFYLKQINDVKLGSDGRNHNKLQFYSSLKGSFKPEPYVELVSRNQRAEVSRVRMSAHRLRVETARYQVNTDIYDYDTSRWCIYCKVPDTAGTRDEEYHLFSCPCFANQQQCLFGKISSVVWGFQDLSFEDKVKSLLCSKNATICRLVNKFIKIVFKGRDKIDDGAHPLSLTFPPTVTQSDSDSESEYVTSDSDGNTDCDFD